jgi:predicted RecB family nuclease
MSQPHLLNGIGQFHTRTLYNVGLKTIDAPKKAPIEKLTSLSLIGLKLAKKIKDQAGGFIKAEEWEQRTITEY